MRDPDLAEFSGDELRAMSDRMAAQREALPAELQVVDEPTDAE